MDIARRSTLIYGFLLAVWVLVAAWQVDEHVRVKETAKTDLRRNSKAIASTLGAVIRGQQFRGTVFRDRLEPSLNELVWSYTNEAVRSSEVLSIALLNAAGESVSAAGRPIDLE